MIYGNPEAKILFVLSYPSRQPGPGHFPLEGSIGVEATQIINAAGLDTLSCAYTYAYPHYVNSREEEDFFYRTKTEAKKEPHALWPDGTYTIPSLRDHAEELRQLIRGRQDQIIFAIGDIATLCLTGQVSSTKLRGSMLNIEDRKVIPTLDFRMVMLKYELKWQIITDLRRGIKNKDLPKFVEPDWNFHVNPNYQQVLFILSELETRAARGPLTLAVDIETVNPHISCIGIAWTTLDALCIPFIFETPTNGNPNYWTEQQELNIILKLRSLFTHKNVSCVGQNFVYDCQYIARAWGFLPNIGWDTMIAYHTVFSADSPKGLDFLASYFCDYYVFWKEESRHRGDNVDDITHWRYNCKDCVVTLEVLPPILESIKNFKQEEQANFQMTMMRRALMLTLAGNCWNKTLQQQIQMGLITQITAFENVLSRLIPEDIYFGKQKKDASPYYASPKKLATLLYDIFGLPLQRNKKTKRPSTDDDALTALAKGDPLFRPLLELILLYRSLGVFKRTYADAKTSPDGRIRTSYNVGGTSTYRFSSSKDAFDDGLNLQTMSKGDAE